MVSKELRVVVEGEEGEALAAAGDELQPVSPTGQYFNSSVLSVGILGVFESDVPIDDSPTMSTLNNLFLPINPRFSSIMVRDEQGIKRWKKVNVKLEDHVNVPVFPSGLESYDDYVEDYISKIAMDQLPPNQPLWNVHVIKYPTSNGAGTVVFKLHHALGDGFSLMGALFSCLQRADNPSLPLTFPASSKKQKSSENGALPVFGKLPRALSMCLSTVRDFGWSLLKSNFVDDDTSPIRSGEVGVEFRPITVSTVYFPLDDIRTIKAKLGATVNDAITGVIFYGTQLYMQAAGSQGGNAAQATALVLLNTRRIGSYQTLSEMTKPKTESPWGNHFGFLHVAVPSCKDAENANPLDFVVKARQVIKAKRTSFAIFLTGRLLEMMRKLRGPEVTARYIHATLKNTSMTISNLPGPIEQMLIADHPVRSFHFMVVGVPQSLTITIVSYMGKLKVAIGTEKGFINSKLLISCMEESFKRIFEAAVAMKA